MFEIDKKTFGIFLSEQRKAKGFTQRELAEKLFVSDKAVSKWERGLSMPDISLLMPLAEILDVSVTELLEGKKMDQSGEIKAEEVENIVKKALALSEETPEKNIERRRKRLLVFGACVLITIIELTAAMWLLAETGRRNIFSDFRGILITEALLLAFGVYFWFFIKEKLPSYYDENKINAYSDGVFRLNLPGVGFNNSNWPHIIKCMRVWLAAAMAAVPPVAFTGAVLPLEPEAVTILKMILLILCLASLFIPLYIAAKKY